MVMRQRLLGVDMRRKFFSAADEGMNVDDLLAIIEVGHGILAITSKCPAMWYTVAFYPLIEDAAAYMVHSGEEPAKIVVLILLFVVVDAVD